MSFQFKAFRRSFFFLRYGSRAAVQRWREYTGRRWRNMRGDRCRVVILGRWSMTVRRLTPGE